jgi:hypothetical protein
MFIKPDELVLLANWLSKTNVKEELQKVIIDTAEKSADINTEIQKIAKSLLEGGYNKMKGVALDTLVKGDQTQLNNLFIMPFSNTIRPFILEIKRLKLQVPIKPYEISTNNTNPPPGSRGGGGGGAGGGGGGGGGGTGLLLGGGAGSGSGGGGGGGGPLLGGGGATGNKQQQLTEILEKIVDISDRTPQELVDLNKNTNPELKKLLNASDKAIIAKAAFRIKTLPNLINVTGLPDYGIILRSITQERRSINTFAVTGLDFSLEIKDASGNNVKIPMTRQKLKDLLKQDLAEAETLVKQHQDVYLQKGGSRRKHTRRKANKNK